MIFFPLFATSPVTNTVDLNFPPMNVVAFTSMTGLGLRQVAFMNFAGITQYTKVDPASGVRTTVDLTTAGFFFNCAPIFSANNVDSVSVAIRVDPGFGSLPAQIEAGLQIFNVNFTLS